MLEAYFVKVDSKITWFDVLNLIQFQIRNSRKKLPYISIADLILSEEDFEDLVDDISQPHPSLVSFANKSMADADGVWNCITIICASDARRIVIYTAGRTIPLYVTVNTGSADEV